MIAPPLKVSAASAAIPSPGGKVAQAKPESEEERRNLIISDSSVSLLPYQWFHRHCETASEHPNWKISELLTQEIPNIWFCLYHTPFPRGYSVGSHPAPPPISPDGNRNRLYNFQSHIACETAKDTDIKTDITILLLLLLSFFVAFVRFSSVFHFVPFRRSSSAPCGGTFPPGEGFIRYQY